MKKSDKTKQKILKETIELISKKGYAATSTREIAEKADVSEATIFKYYKSKDNLLQTIVMDTVEKLFKTSSKEKIPNILNNNKDKNSKELLRLLIRERLDFFGTHKKEFKVIFQEMLINKKVQRYVKEKVWNKMVDVSDEIYFHIKSNHQLKKDLDPYMFRKTLFGILFFTILFEEIIDDDKILNNEEQSKLISEIIFSGIKEKE